MTANSDDANRFVLNDPQQRHLLASCRYVDKLLSSIESILWASRSSSPFPMYRTTVTPMQARLSVDYLAHIRSRLVRVLESQGVRIPPAQGDALHAIRTTLLFADNAVEELRPTYMRGYGDLPDGLEADVDGVVDELRTVLLWFNDALAQDAGRSLEAQLDRLDADDGDAEAVRTLERIVSTRRLLEFRPTLAMIVDRLVSPTYEIAVFGRVSSGKSSLLNHILGANVLSVGVTPTTAVPTRLIYGDPPGVTAWFADSPAVTRPLALLPGLVTEHLNPGNQRHVTRVDVRYPAPRLAHGIVMVDTPGLGSLATHGADETMAYLPRCDLGVVLIDAGSTLMPDDLMTLRALVQAGSSAAVLLSKSDLLSPDDRARAAGYIAEHVQTGLGLHVPVHAVSTLGEHASLTDTWFATALKPMCERHRELARHSIRRKIVLLCDAVRTSLRASAARRAGKAPVDEHLLATAETALRRAGALAAGVVPQGELVAETVTGAASAVVRQAATLLVDAGRGMDLTVEGATAALERAVQDTVGVQAEGLRNDVVRLATEVAAALGRAADTLGRAGAPTAAELMTRVRVLPALVLPHIAEPLSAPGVFAMTRSLRIRGIEHQLDVRIGQPLTTVLSAFGASLRGWMREAVGRVQHDFHEYAEPLRVFIEKERAAPAGASDPQGGDASAIRDDLGALARICGEAPLGDSARETP